MEGDRYPPTWRIMPGIVVISDYGDQFLSPKDRVVGPLPNGHSWLINGG